MMRKLRRILSRDRGASRPDANVLLERGNEHASRQQWQLARDCFVAAARLERNLAEAHAYLGNVLRQLREFDAALLAYDRAIEVKPDYAEAHYNRGTLLQHTGLYEAAVESFEAALRFNANLAQAWCRRGDALWMLGRLAAADESYRQAIALESGDMEAHINLGMLQIKAGAHSEALRTFDAAIKADPANASVYHGRGLAQMALNRPEDALASFENAIRLRPAYAQAFSGRARAEARLGLLAEANASHDEATRLDPHDAQILINRADSLSDLREWRAATECYQAAINLSPSRTDAHCNLGLCYQEMGEFELALASYARALALNPRLPEVFNNRGNLYRSRKKFAEAAREYGEALALNSDYVEAHYNLGQLALIQGRLREGWPDYEWRCGIEEAMSQHLCRGPEPAWLGDAPLWGKRIVLYAEQGLGDTIQFCRYASLVAALGAQVTLEVQPALCELLARLAGVSQVLVAGAPRAPADFQCSLMSLPAAFKSELDTIPRQVPYLQAGEQKVEYWRTLLGPRTRPRIGLAWSGNPNQRSDRQRSMTLSQLVNALPTDLEYHCVQKDIRDSDKETLRASRLIKTHDSFLKTFEDTAGLLAGLDLVITVCTSVAHLSGAMAKPTWVLLPFLPDWRWMLDRQDSPWYPTALLYRQPAPDDWHSVTLAIRKALTLRYPAVGA